ncbi:hypothetical protein APUTEX25_003365, partial [Auxenochlorella protothecoides]|uniref:Uncharacterized protein n=2 Tax=Auxenochlorella protothecoides TaxID=3075 RepID=A0A1D1ZW77_AUXPR
MCQPKLPPPSDLVAGLTSSPPTLPCRFLYDAKGSQLYSQITDLPEYTPYRAELGLLKEHGTKLATLIPPHALVVELGCGDATKTSHLIHSLLASREPGAVRFVGIDVCAEALRQTDRTLRERCPDLPAAGIQLVEADYLTGLRAVRSANPDATLCLLWLGSSIGNFGEGEASEFLAGLVAAAGGDTRVILGADGWKDRGVLHAAYCDAAGVTERFIVNGVQHALRLLRHPDARAADLWDYEVVVNERRSQVEMWVSPKRRVSDIVPGVSLEAGEKLLVEISRKFTPLSIAALADQAGLVVQESWRTPGYSLQLLLPAVQALQDAWRDTDTLFSSVASWSAQPIGLRHPFSFYYGHLASFARSRLLPGRPAGHLDLLYSRGIDPCVVDPSRCHAHPPPPPTWPGREEVRAYAVGVRAEVLADARALPARTHALHMVLEHERMHQETLCYMLAQQRGADAALTQREGVLGALAGRWAGCSYRATEQRCADAAWVHVPATQIQLGLGRAARHGFVWDNELGTPAPQAVPAFRLASHPVSVREYKAFMDEAQPYEREGLWSAGDWAHISSSGWKRPAGWILDQEGRLHVGLPEAVYQWEEVADCPVYVSLAEAEAFARWAGGRVMTEEEYAAAVQHKELQGLLRSVAAEADEQATAHCLESGGWEWTSTPFKPFQGFKADPMYPEYSVDFFDDQHYVLKGASPYTHPSIQRGTFRNFYQRLYPFVMAKFRVVLEATMASA